MMDVSSVAMLVVKILSLIGLGLYFIFAAVIVRQERHMSAVINEGFEPVLKLLVLLHLFAAIGVFVLAIFVL